MCIEKEDYIEKIIFKEQNTFFFSFQILPLILCDIYLGNLITKFVLTACSLTIPSHYYRMNCGCDIFNCSM